MPPILVKPPQQLPLNLATADSDPNPQAGYQSASVMLLLTPLDGQWQLLFIRRPKNPQDPHSGQVAFPGGKREPQDVDLLATAIRETSEEIGLQQNKISIKGRLPPVLVPSGYEVHPFVGTTTLDISSLTPQAEEVDRIFTIPLQWLADKKNREFEKVDHNGHLEKLVFKPYDNEVLWGASAKMLHHLLESIK